MSIDEKKIADVLDAIATINDDVKVKSYLMPVLCRLIDQYREILPVELVQYVELASAYWGHGEASAQGIEDARVQCWMFLERKGHATGIADAEDAAVRALICLLYRESHDEHHVADIAEFFLSSVKRIQEGNPYANERIDALIAEWLQKMGAG
jgi:hypothetical protein